MNNSGLQRIVPIALVIIIIIVAVAAVVSVGRNIFGGGSDTTTVNVGKEALLNTAEDHSVRMTVRGPIVGDDVFHTYVVTASPTTRSLTTYQGYLSNQLDTNQLSNNSKGYEELVYALDRAKMMDADELTGDANDMRGVCANGKLYVYEVLQASNVVKTLWATSCSNVKGSLKVNNQVILRLFNRQIPDYDKLTTKVNL